MIDIKKACPSFCLRISALDRGSREITGGSPALGANIVDAVLYVSVIYSAFERLCHTE